MNSKLGFFNIPCKKITIKLQLWITSCFNDAFSYKNNPIKNSKKKIYLKVWIG